MSRRLNIDETENCLKLWRETSDKDALELLTICNIGLVNYIAKKYIGTGLTYDELVSAGTYGLLKAINKFNYKDNDVRAFSTYIAVAIDNAIKYELRLYRKHSHVLSFDQPLGQNKDGDELTIEEIVGTDSEELVENAINDMKIDIVRESLKSLTSREQQIILLRYGLDENNRKTQEELAQIFGCTKTTIANQEKKALIKMRHPRITKKLKDFVD